MPGTRTAAVATALVAALCAGPLVVPSFAASGTAKVTAERDGLDRPALRAAVAGLPHADATAALVRVGGEHGVWRAGAGVRDLATGRDAIRDGRFRAGSTTKVVTSALVLQLAAEGRVDLDAPVQDYLPGLLTPEFKPVAVRQLLNCTSGIRSAWAESPWDELYAGRLDTVDHRKVVAAAVAQGPAHDPGEVQLYSNIHYTILGMLIEKVTGRAYAREAQRRIFRPLGMDDTYFPGADPRIRGPHNRGYQKVRQPDGTAEYVDVTRWNQYDRFAAGDMISTTADLERLLTALFKGKVVPRPQLEEMFTVPDVPNSLDPARAGRASMGAGLQRYVTQGGTEVWLKTGGRYGYHTLVAGTRDLSRTLVYSIGSTDAKGEGMNRVGEGLAVAVFGR
ncbi:serine hydrolase domain-containing protein [Streptomyces uncialis]|uniref:serine hydrolase domain-containing protein n=1 Tax=Streptomyces uncialis TaxID=1048205 RepID=UPI0037AB525B